ncbi:hypothetical protein DV737_g1284, partial [Chaetothyriales sp. CBS 132003]
MSGPETVGSAGSGHPDLHLTAEEKQVYGKLLKEADPDGFGVVSGDIAVKFFERTRLAADVLGQIWQIADTQNRGFLTPAGFGVVLRLIGHAQSGRAPSAQLATQPAPLPKFDGQTAGSSVAPPAAPPAALTAAAPLPSPSAIRVPPLGPDKVAEYWQLFDKSGADNGVLPGVVAKQIFERARLPNEVLGRIWALSDTRSRGGLDVTEFVIAMHLLAAYKSGQLRGVPSTLPPGLYEAAARRPAARSATVRAQSPSVRPPGLGSPLPLSAQSTGDGWAVSAADKARFDAIFATVDKAGAGYISGEQAVDFFGNARLPEEVLAQIWDLADIGCEGRLDRDEFAVAMYLIRQQRGTKDGRGNLPATLPPALVPPSRRQARPAEPMAPAFESAPAAAAKARSAADDLFGLDAFGDAAPAPALPLPLAQPQLAQSTGGTDAGPFGNAAAAAAAAAAATTSISTSTSTTFKPFVPSSSFGQSLQPQSTGSPAPPAQARAGAAHDDLLGDTDPDESAKLTSETSELANLSNQVGSLSTQMTDLQGQRAQAEHELAQQTAQKRAFEARLAQLRTLYENEATQVKALQAQLQTVRNETKRLQTDHAVVGATHQDLTSQHRQLQAQLEADQGENAALKDRISQTNQDIDRLKRQLEKLKSDARQQKGLVAINKKQLATNEAERDRLKADAAAAQREVHDWQRHIDHVRVPSSANSAGAAPPATASNPFFRAASTASSPAQKSVRRTLPTGPAQPEEQNVGEQNVGEQNVGEPTATVGGVPGGFPDTPTPRAETTERADGPSPLVLGAGAAALAGGAAVAAATALSGQDKGKAPAESPEDAKDSFDHFNSPAVRDKGEDSFNWPTVRDKGKEPEARPEVASSVPDRLLAPRVEDERRQPSPASSLPGFDAAEQQGSPPGYSEAVPDNNPSHFPREYKGLLAEREVPASAHAAGGEGASASSPPAQAPPPSYSPEVAKLQSPEVGGQQSRSADPPAHLAFSTHNAGANGSASPLSKADQFDFDKFQPAPPVPASVAALASGTSEAPKSHDWDDIFAGLSSSSNGPHVAKAKDFDEPSTPVQDHAPISSEGAAAAAPGTLPGLTTSSPNATTTTAPEIDRPRVGESTTSNAPPPLTRVISTASEHDDPILKRLTAMGWSRSESLAALEKYDYNIDKVSPPPGTAIRKATLADAAAIAQLGRSVFTDTFGFSIPSNDLQAYLDDVYSLAAIEADIASPTKHIFVATPTTPLASPNPALPNSALPSPVLPPPPPPILGFVQLTENTTEPCLADITGLVELQRLYVRGDCHGRGLGKALAGHAESLARHQLGYSNVWLGVWEGNFIAQRVYEAMGYERVGEHEFTMGRCVQIDWIMAKPLD